MIAQNACVLILYTNEHTTIHIDYGAGSTTRKAGFRKGCGGRIRRCCRQGIPGLEFAENMGILDVAIIVKAVLTDLTGRWID